MPKVQYLTAAEVDTHLERDTDKHGMGIVISNSQCDTCADHGWVVIIVFRAPDAPHTAYQRICSSCMLGIALQVGTHAAPKGNH